MLRIKLLAAAATTALLIAPAALAQAAPAQPAPAAAPAPTPVAAENVIEVLKMHGRFTTLLQALDQAQLTETLATRPRITLFAPTDEVFAALPEAERTRLLDPANVQELRNLMLYHVLVADLTPDQIMGARGPIATAGGLEVNIDGTGEAIAIDNATVTGPAIDAANGGIYVIDKLLDPEAAAQGDSEEAEAATAAPAEAAPAPDGSTPPATPSN
ncbi:fasciclin domain-containing protein [Brevundimonas sp. LjRoot202]|uniref:fasciclin domain-containing protein n=1 Tax=Brevundimonas sp. LjRoot202 TaxID=3342281 RepID=UPI003ECFED30